MTTEGQGLVGIGGWIGCSTICFRHLLVRDALSAIKRLGFSECDLGVMPGFCDHYRTVDATDAGRKGFVAMVQDSGLGVRTVNGNPGYFSSPGASPSEIRRAFEEMTRLGRDLGAVGVSIAPGDAAPASEIDGVLRIEARGVRELAAIAADHGQALLLEAHFFRLPKTVNIAMRMFDMIDRPDVVGYVLDTAHVRSGGDDVVEVAARLGARLAHVHLRDAIPGTGFLEIGAGDVDFARLLSMLRRDRPDVHCSFELPDLGPNSGYIPADLAAARRPSETGQTADPTMAKEDEIRRAVRELQVSLRSAAANDNPAAQSAAAQVRPHVDGPPDLLELRDISKHFTGVQALRDVDFDLRVGEVHALLGENGAGKSTLIKVFSGALVPDSGTIRLDGESVAIRDTREAWARGIATIYQETSLYPDLSVVENLFMGRQPVKRFGLVDWPRMRAEAITVFDRLGVQMELDARLSDLSKAESQLVEIAKALLHEARILIMDEPGSALPSFEMERLYGIIGDLRKRGVAIIYITHRLDEIFRTADRVTVLRDGRKVETARVADIDEDWLVQRMVGRSIRQLYDRHTHPAGDVLLEISHLSSPGIYEDISFVVRAREIVALAGLVGSGRSEVARAIFGLDRHASGSLKVGGRPLSIRPWKAGSAGLALIPEDRGRQGLIAQLTVQSNIALSSLGALRRGMRIDSGAERSLAQRFIHSLQIHPDRPDITAANLSGGNQQKVVLGRSLATNPRVLILDEPTNGVDVGAKTQIHRTMDQLVAEGMGMLLISSDLSEVLGMADRILIMRQGQIVAELPRGSSAEEVMRFVVGVGATANVQ